MEIFYFWFLPVNSQLGAGFACTARTRGGTKRRRRNREMLHLVKSSVAIAGSLQRIALMNPKPGCRCQPDLTISTETQRQPCGKQNLGFLMPRVAAGPAWTDRQAPTFSLLAASMSMVFQGVEMLCFIDSFHACSRSHS